MNLMAFMEAMGTSNISLVAAFFIGLMMAISPCPLATNITAVAYASRNLKDKTKTFFTGLSYTLGRVFSYVLITSLIVLLGINVQAISLGLQKYGERIIGPLLILIGIILFEIIKLDFIKSSNSFVKLKEKLATKGFIGSFLLGVLFALAFCPFSAVLFFGMLIPLALSHSDPILIPSVFALATGLPVIVLSLILAYSVSSLGKTMKKIQTFEKYTRFVIASIFLIVGVYYTWRIWI
jgi:cytochrome c biogenesis protein CcdA